MGNVFILHVKTVNLVILFFNKDQSGRVEDRNDLGERSEDLRFSRGEGSGKDEGRN